MRARPSPMHNELGDVLEPNAQCTPEPKRDALARPPEPSRGYAATLPQCTLTWQRPHRHRHHHYFKNGSLFD